MTNDSYTMCLYGLVLVFESESTLIKLQLCTSYQSIGKSGICPPLMIFITILMMHALIKHRQSIIDPKNLSANYINMNCYINHIKVPREILAGQMKLPMSVFIYAKLKANYIQIYFCCQHHINANYIYFSVKPLKHQKHKIKSVSIGL